MILCAAPPPKLADEIGQSAVDVNSGPQNIFLWPRESQLDGDNDCKGNEAVRGRARNIFLNRARRKTGMRFQDHKGVNELELA